MGLKLWILVLFPALIGAWSLSYSALAEDDPVIAFADDAAVELGPEQTTVIVVNNTTEPVDIVVTAEMRPSAGGEAIPISIENAPQVIEGSGSVPITVGPATGTPGSGFITISADGTVIRRPIVEKKATSAPAISDWNGSNRKSVPAIPLDGSSCSIPDGSVHIVSGEDIATLEYHCSDDGASILIDDSGVAEPGEYKGALKIGEASISMTYLETSSLWLPLILILIGFLLAAWQQAWTNNYRPLWRAERRLTRLGGEAADAQLEFEREAHASSFRNYSVVQGAYQQVATLQLRLTRLRPPLVRRYLFAWIPWAKDEHEDQYNEVLKDMAGMRDLVSAWRDASDGFTVLSGAVKSTKAAGLDGLAPGLIAAADLLLDPSKGTGSTIDLSYTDAVKVVADIARYKTAIELLPAVKQLGDALVNLEPTEGNYADGELWDQARHLHHQIVAEFTLARNVDAIENAKVDELVKSCRSLVLRLPEPKAAGAIFQALEERLPDRTLPAPVGLFSRLIHGSVNRGGGIRAVDLAWLLLAFAIAIWTGLALLYFDKPWGGLQDSGAMLAWAYGTTTVLTPLFTRLENFASAPLRLKQTDD